MDGLIFGEKTYEAKAENATRIIGAVFFVANFMMLALQMLMSSRIKEELGWESHPNDVINLSITCLIAASYISVCVVGITGWLVVKRRYKERKQTDSIEKKTEIINQKVWAAFYASIVALMVSFVLMHYASLTISNAHQLTDSMVLLGMTWPILGSGILGIIVGLLCVWQYKKKTILNLYKELRENECKGTLEEAISKQGKIN